MVFRLTRYFFLISLLRAEAFWSQSVPQHNIGPNRRIYFKDFFLKIFTESVTILLLCFGFSPPRDGALLSLCLQLWHVSSLPPAPPLEAPGRGPHKITRREREREKALLIKYLPQPLKPLLKMGHGRSANGQEPSQPCVGDLVAHFVKWEQLIPVVLRTQLKLRPKSFC